MSIRTDIKGKSLKVETLNDRNVAEITSVVKGLLETHTNLYEDQNGVIIGYVENEKVKTIAKAFKSSCYPSSYSCSDDEQFVKIVYGDFECEIPIVSFDVFNGYVFDKMVF